MEAPAGRNLTERAGLRRSPRARRSALSAAVLVLLVLCCLFAAAAPAGAATKPGKPTAKAPKGATASATPTFKWSKARGAARYELRVYQGKQQQLKKTGLRKLSWKSSKALPANVALTWKVRASNPDGVGSWSRSLTFTVGAAPGSAKAITAFSFAVPAATGVINESLHTIAVSVPLGTNVAALVASFTTTGTSVSISGTPQVSGTTANNFINPVTYMVTAADASTQSYLVTVTASSASAKAITAFGFGVPAATGVINESLHTIAVSVPSGTNVAALVASFTTTGASVRVGATPQVSGYTANNFTSPVTYTVVAADASTQAYAVTVTVASGPSSAKAITAFSFASPPATGVINETLHTIAATVPFGTNVSALVPSITISGASVNPLSGVARNFTSPVTYTVTAADASTQAYVVTVTVAASGPSSAKAITAFSFASPAATGVINETLHTIAVTVPFGTDVSALVPSITITGASVGPASGVARNFTSPVTYTVTAADSTTQPYAVTVTVTPLAIGDPYQGGKVAYIDGTGQHGLIAAATDQSTAMRWYNGSLTLTGAAATALGTGSGNTTTIITSQGAVATSYAAGLARAYNGGGYSDWYLPSKDELNKLYVNQAAIGGFDLGAGGDGGYGTGPYWSSSEVGANYAWAQYFSTGTPHVDWKFGADYRVRAVRAFPADPAKVITSFSFSTPAVTGFISEAAHTIALTVPFGTDVSALVATFATTGAAVAVGATPQVSGTTANDFTGAVTYTVTAADASTQDYLVTVYYIGKSFQGGKIAYILRAGDPGYVAGAVHGLIAALADQSDGVQWYKGVDVVTGATATELGTGEANTSTINGVQGSVGGPSAAEIARSYTDALGYFWSLPSKDELNKLYVSKDAIGGFAVGYYWSSSERGASSAWDQNFGNGDQGTLSSKYRTNRVRAVRTFVD